MMENNEISQDFENLIIKFMGNSDITQKIQDMVNRNEKRLVIDIDKLRQFDQNLLIMLIKNPLKVIPMFENHLLELTNELQNSSGKIKTQKNEKTVTKKQVYTVTFEGTFGRNMVSPRGLTADLTNQLVCIQGIITRMSIVRPKLETSVHYCEDTKSGSVKEYYDHYSISLNNPNSINGNLVAAEGAGSSYISNTVPKKDIHGNPLSFEYGLSSFRDFQTLLVQEPPERTPIGQLPRSVEVILRDDLVDKVKPGDR
jgi:DNA replication licensing factor MCM3